MTILIPQDTRVRRLKCSPIAEKGVVFPHTLRLIFRIGGGNDAMGILSGKKKWESTFRLRSHPSAGRGFLTVLFWLWGSIGLLLNGGSLMGLTGSVGVGTSAYLTATSLIWIGGMILFGLGALLSHNDFDGERPADPDVGDLNITR
ncbi:hypothetical protein [Bradyrhizobium sp. SZCCHNR1051]|uniref:hypothetical protein n=1 Tax=Bradyrhizobium sp. SZCCHNR1051 TaxID=3057355 RepID=UPI002916E411|nr:hypothetical protein [Bradyrhizobium sp. SZCCHNR1051]